MPFKKFSKIIFATSKIAAGNMSFNYGSFEQTLKNRTEFFQQFGVDIQSIAEVQQVHSNRVVYIKDTSQNNTEADGLITNKPGLFLLMKAADCHQIAFFDPSARAIGLVHAGWRGLKKGIIQKTITKMSQIFDSNLHDLIVAFGPSIGPCHYHTDIWKQAEEELIRSGILKENVYNPQICTYHDPDYFSHRQAEDENLKEARFITVLGLKKQTKKKLDID